MTKTVIIIAGPTAAGKTALAIELAKSLDTEIISADSRQCYREMNIGVARPSPAELATVKHYFIASHTIQSAVNAAGFEQYALQIAEQLFKRHDTIVMVGGTGLYIKAFCEGLDVMPQVPASVRTRIVEQYENNGISWLQQELRTRDPLFFETGEIENPHRLMRALEMVTHTGRSIREFQSNKRTTRPFNIIKIGIAPPKNILHQQITRRVHQMMSDGLLEEVRSLVPYRHLGPLQTVGYKEIFAYLDRQTTLDEAVENIIIHTRQYAKRQLTWFRKDPEITWVEPANADVMQVITNLRKSSK